MVYMVIQQIIPSLGITLNQ